MRAFHKRSFCSRNTLPPPSPLAPLVAGPPTTPSSLFEFDKTDWRKHPLHYCKG